MERVLERYEVLYEAGLVAEAERDHGGSINVGNENDLPHTAQAATG